MPEAAALLYSSQHNFFHQRIDMNSKWIPTEIDYLCFRGIVYIFRLENACVNNYENVPNFLVI